MWRLGAEAEQPIPKIVKCCAKRTIEPKGIGRYFLRTVIGKNNEFFSLSLILAKRKEEKQN